ncbi:hypothetical protein CROQUDRAFT_84518 [Cronartium quercuum f. sp. fusiforme G11]|uniref:Peptidase M48 domain-containing protein n=1 Tax=Cronartium quercuum f. sp. fusiforme G11 TaxID=708437 RepID=A0A9P6N644_9BASI|nr:hypothetical protein CROQUDRAFT_84518 [Cronartium quercuum f. sp. fusiforme G11]
MTKMVLRLLTQLGLKGLPRSQPTRLNRQGSTGSISNLGFHQKLAHIRTFATFPSKQTSYRRFGEPRRTSSPQPQIVWGFQLPLGNHGYSFKRRFQGMPTWVWWLVGGSGVYYVGHLEKVEQTGRWRFMDTSVDSELATGRQAYAQTLAQYRHKILPAHHPTSVYVTKVAHRIIKASELASESELSDDPFLKQQSWSDTGVVNLERGKILDWKIHVIDEPRIQNAFVIPGGKIFVFTGILPICQTDSGLATVLGHEVAHQVLRHTAERMSSMKVIFALTTVLSMMGLDFGFSRALVTLLMTLPNSRKSETEADQIGLNIMAKACYDPTESIRMWKRMEKHEHQLKNSAQVTEFLQTHPAHQRRIQNISGWLADAERYREAHCGFTTQAAMRFDRWQPS